jgi:hypothetical protein
MTTLRRRKRRIWVFRASGAFCRSYDHVLGIHVRRASSQRKEQNHLPQRPGVIQSPMSEAKQWVSMWHSAQA